MSATWTSVPFGMSTSEACSSTRHIEAEKVSGIVLRMTRGNERSFMISLPLPLIRTVTPSGCCRTVRPGGIATASRTAKLWERGCCAATATYSITAKNIAASLMGQLRTNSCPRLPRIDQLPDQGLGDGSVPLRGPDHLLDDDPVAVDDEALGHAGGLVDPLDHARAILQDIKREAELAREHRDRTRIGVVDAHRHDVKVAAGELAVQPLER